MVADLAVPISPLTVVDGQAGHAALHQQDREYIEALRQRPASSTTVTTSGLTKALGVLHAGLAARLTSPCRIVFTGSSTTVGLNATTTANRYVNRLVTALQAAYPSGLGSETTVVASNTATFGTPSTAAGVHGYNAAESGTNASTYLTAAERTSIGALNPRAVFHMIGSNDYAGARAIATFKTNVLTAVNDLKAKTAGPCVQVLVHSYQRLDVTSPAIPWASYGAALAEIAAADPDNVAFLDISEPYRLAGVPGDDPLNLVDTDGIHQTDAGHALMANLLRGALDEFEGRSSGGATTSPRLGILRVASSQAPADVKEQADYVCTGGDDQAVINQALLAASRPADGFGGIGAGCVELVGPNFFIGNNDTGVITMYPSTWLRGSGYGTLVQPMYATFTGLGAIQLFNASTDHTRVSDLAIGRPNDQLVRCHGIKYEQSGSGSAYEIDSGSDPFHRIHDLNVHKAQGHGVYLLGTSGGARETHVDHVLSWNATGAGFRMEGASDCKLTACTAAGAGGDGPGYYVGGGNAKLANCKSYYAEGSNDGFQVVSGRAEIVGCSAQDNGRYGYNVTGGDVTIVGCVADSNARVDAAGGGFSLASAGTFADLHAFDRGQTPASPQLRGIVFSGTPQVFLTGRVRVPSGTAHVVGAPGANSHMRVVRDGTTLATAD